MTSPLAGTRGILEGTNEIVRVIVARGLVGAA
jgi:hypothetical protein